MAEMSEERKELELSKIQLKRLMSIYDRFARAKDIDLSDRDFVKVMHDRFIKDNEIEVGDPNR